MKLLEGFSKIQMKDFKDFCLKLSYKISCLFLITEFEVLNHFREQLNPGTLKFYFRMYFNFPRKQITWIDVTRAHCKTGQLIATVNSAYMKEAFSEILTIVSVFSRLTQTFHPIKEMLQITQ